MKKSKRSTPAPAPSPPPGLDWRDLVAAAWALGVLAIFLRQLLAAVAG